MTGEMRHVVGSVIRQKIYREEKFPSALFPDLVPVLTSLFLRKRSAFDIRETENAKTTDRDLEDEIRSVVGLKALLEEDPGTLILIYRELIFRYVRRKNYNRDEVEETVQEIIRRFLEEKIRGVRKRFDFSDPAMPTFTSYFMVTIRNIYIDIIRKGSREINLVENDMEIETLRGRDTGSVINSLILDEEFRKFHTLLRLFFRSGSKLRLALKVRFNIPVEDEDILKCFPQCTRKEMDLFKRKPISLKNKNKMENIAGIFNKYEKKSNNPDTLRKWISTKMEELRRHMNRQHPGRPYTNSILSDFIILYFKWEEDHGG